MTSTSDPPVDSEVHTRYAAEVARQVELQHAGLRALVEANQRLLGSDPLPLHPAAGSLQLATAYVYGLVQVQATFLSGAKPSFEAKVYGSALGAGASVGAFAFNVAPDELIGRCSVNVTVTSEGCAAHWWRGEQYLGSYLGTGFGRAVDVPMSAGAWTV